MITYAALALALFVLHWLAVRVIGFGLLLMVLSASGCMLQVPGDPPVRICYPANSWRCSPHAEWSDM